MQAALSANFMMTTTLNTPDLAFHSVPKIYGAPMEHLPTDLFIPPDALEIILEAFEGPLDLLLYLIRKQNLNILDIPMAPLTTQYLGYVEEIRKHNFELASDYLLMAAMLIEIKSRMLLPKLRKHNEDDTAEDPRTELARRLIEYEQIKFAAQALDALPQKERDFFVAQVEWESIWKSPLPKVSLLDLQDSMNAILRRSALNQRYHITREELSVRAHMSSILKQLSALSAQEFLSFEELVDNSELSMSLPSLVVHFVALLELIREGLIQISQTDAYQPIYISLAQAEQSSLI